MVTGASDGIGEEYAVQLAQRGFNIVIISRTLSKMEKVKTRVEKEGAKCRLVQRDFTGNTTQSFYEEIEKETRDIDVSMLINNAGVMHVGTIFEASPF